MERRATPCTSIIADYVNVNPVDDDFSRGPLAWIQTSRGARTGDTLYATTQSATAMVTRTKHAL